MKKSSMHVKGVKPSSERHNTREQKLDYVREDLTPLNESYSVQSINEARKNAEELYQKTVGQKIQAKAEPIREGVLLVDKHHTIEDLKKLADCLEKEFGIRTIQAYIHKDEGHYDKETKEWKPNLHAHMVFDWTDKQTGKSIRLNREGYAKLQTVVAQELGMERGVSSSVKHLNSVQYKNLKEEQDLQKTYNLTNGLSEAKKIIKQVEPLKKEVDELKTVKKSLSDETQLMRANLNYLGEKTEKQREELKQIEEKTKEIKQSRGLSR
jgi:hypothetical protein